MYTSIYTKKGKKKSEEYKTMIKQAEHTQNGSQD